MIHEYNITGMTCSGCEAKVKSALLKLPEVLSATITRSPGRSVIEMNNHIPITRLQSAISPEGKYVISAITDQPVVITQQKRSWLQTYQPLILIFSFLLIGSFVASVNSGFLNPLVWMNNFMAGFFLTFSFFKFLDLKGFANGYSTYDLLAKKWKPYGYIYPFLELVFGLWLLSGINHTWLYILILGVMTFSTFGVINSLRKKQTIECACLGTIFKLPLGTVTLSEDLLMVVMSAVMIMIQ